jgi:predicted CopG family antitoxin
MTQQKQTQLEIFEQTAKTSHQADVAREIVDKVSDFKFPSQLCLRCASLLIVVLISFALGVERGKLISKKKISARFLAETQSPAEVKEIKMDADVAEEPIVKAEPEDKNLEKEEKNDTMQTSGYIIQVASYKKNSSYIDKEVTRLEKDGYKTMTVSSSSGEYMGICTGGYPDKQEAQKYLKELQRTYKDCFIRKI